MSTTELTEALRATIQGDVVAPGDPEFDEARLAWNLAADQRPALVVLAERDDDVIATVDFARSHGLRVATQGTGHGAAALGSLDRTLLLRTSRMRTVQVDPEGRRARVEAGAIWIDLAHAAAPHGLACLAGSSPDVGIVGYSLGGGIGWLARRHGMAAASIRAVELVTADAQLVRADSSSERELLWALRGGGGSFGAVTALELDLYPLAEVYAGAMLWPIDRASEVLHAYREWAPTLPEDATTCGRLLQLPPLPEIPEPLRGRSFAVVESACVGDEAAAEALVAPLRGLGPEIDTLRTIPAAELSSLHMDPEHPVPGAGDGRLLASLPPEAVDALVEVGGAGSGSPLLSIELRQCGGALARPQDGALATIDGAYAMYAVGIAMTPEMKAAIEVHTERVCAALSPWLSRSHYLNFCERPGRAPGAFGPEVWEQLCSVKRRYDPDNLFQANQELLPAG